MRYSAVADPHSVVLPQYPRVRKLTSPEVRHTTLDLRHMTMHLGVHL